MCYFDNISFSFWFLIWLPFQLTLSPSFYFPVITIKTPPSINLREKTFEELVNILESDPHIPNQVGVCNEIVDRIQKGILFSFLPYRANPTSYSDL